VTYAVFSILHKTKKNSYLHLYIFVKHTQL